MPFKTVSKLVASNAYYCQNVTQPTKQGTSHNNQRKYKKLKAVNDSIGQTESDILHAYEDLQNSNRNKTSHPPKTNKLKKQNAILQNMRISCKC